jgi:hypothetical protein
MTSIRSERLAELANTDFDADAREEDRRNVAVLRRAAPEPNEMHSLIERVAGSSVREIDTLIGELQQVRNLLHSEGERVQRELAGYAHLSRTAMTCINMMSEGMAQWKSDMASRADR